MSQLRPFSAGHVEPSLLGQFYRVFQRSADGVLSPISSNRQQLQSDCARAEKEFRGKTGTCDALPVGATYHRTGRVKQTYRHLDTGQRAGMVAKTPSAQLCNVVAYNQQKVDAGTARIIGGNRIPIYRGRNGRRLWNLR